MQNDGSATYIGFGNKIGDSQKSLERFEKVQGQHTEMHKRQVSQIMGEKKTPEELSDMGQPLMSKINSKGTIKLDGTA